MRRWIAFLLAIAVGIAAGLVYGWVINPVQYVQTTPDSLRLDYRTDYVLMVAETYPVERDLERAARRLAILGGDPAHEIVQEALEFGASVGYAKPDLDLMEDLAAALQAWDPAVGGPGP